MRTDVRRRTAAWTRVVLVNGVLAALLLLGLEGAVRLARPEITPVGTDAALLQDSVYAATPGLRPHAAGTSNGARLQVDARGFWRYAAAAPAGRPGWLFLGDSVTMGLGVAPDSTFAGRLAAGQDTLAVLNPALLGYDVQDYRNVLDHLLNAPPAATPHLARVTLFWCLNDAYSAAPGTAGPGQEVRDLGGPFLTFVRRHFFTYQWLKATLFDRARTYYEHDRQLYTAAVVNAVARDLRAMHARAAARGISFEVVLLPYAYQLRQAEAPDAFRPQQLLGARLTAAGVPVYDAAPFLLTHAAEPEALYLYGDGIHLSAAGHRLVAAFLAAKNR